MEAKNDADKEDIKVLSLNSTDDDLQKKEHTPPKVDSNEFAEKNDHVDSAEAELINLDECNNSTSSEIDKDKLIGEAGESVQDVRTLFETEIINSEINASNLKIASVGKEKSITDNDSIEKDESKETEVKKNNKSSEESSKSEKIKLNELVDYQVQCVNLHCQSGFDLAEAPVFVLTYFGVPRRKNVSQKVCQKCFDFAVEHQQKMCDLLKNNLPLVTAGFPSQKDDVVVMDPVEEIFEEEILPDSIISMVEEQLEELINDAVRKYNINYQLKVSKDFLTKKYESLMVSGKSINDKLNFIDNHLKETRKEIYKNFAPRIRNLPPLNITEPFDEDNTRKRRRSSKSVADEYQVSVVSQIPEPKNSLQSSNSESHDVVALKEVECPKVKLPPIDRLVYPLLFVGAPVYVMKATSFGVWLKARITEVFMPTDEPILYRVRFEPFRGTTHKTVTGKEIAYRKPSKVRYPVGTRVIALFRNFEIPGKDAYYAGVVAEPPKILNSFRYLVFFDDGYAQYVSHEKILLVCESSRHVYEDVHPDSRDFIKSYLNQYPERPMVKLQKGQMVKTESNGKWLPARVLAVDGSLAKMHFEADNKTEWIYRGSTRLGPLFSELVAAAARKEQGALSRHRGLGIASLKKRNMPYVEYSVDQDDAKPQPPTTSKNVAKKSTASKSNSSGGSAAEKLTGHLKPSEKIEYVSKGYVRTMKLSGRISGRKFIPHDCGPPCMNWIEFSQEKTKGINPLAIPLYYGFERQIARCKAKKMIMYTGPCGRRLRNIQEMHRYLKITKCAMGLDYFSFDCWVRALEEFHLEPNMYCTHVMDISYGHENTPVSCVNEINHSWPSFMDYSTSRIPQEGVNICLDEEFLVCCSCTDDCLDKEKCECWQLTIEGTKLGPGGEADPKVGYYYKRLLEPVTTGIYECNQRCKCGPTCLNRVAQHPLQLNLQVFRTLRKGWGLRTLNDIPQGGFICIYAGRLHTEQSANDGGRMYGDEYLAELDYIEVVERFKEGYESDVMEPDTNKDHEEEQDDEDGDEGQDEQDELDESQMNSDDIDYVPEGLSRLPLTENTVNTRGRNKKLSTEEKSESEGEKELENDKECLRVEDDDDEMKKKPSKFTAAVPVAEEKTQKYKSVRELFGDGADDCYIMDAKSSGNIGRYLNHSCQPNVFVQNVFVDTHDVRFPWVAFFALTYIKAGTELTWDYNYDIGSVPDKVLYCYCNSTECRGRLL